jgi:hypothetical protein
MSAPCRVRGLTCPSATNLWTIPERYSSDGTATGVPGTGESVGAGVGSGGSVGDGSGDGLGDGVGDVDGGEAGADVVTGAG